MNTKNNVCALLCDCAGPPRTGDPGICARPGPRGEEPGRPQQRHHLPAPVHWRLHQDDPPRALLQPPPQPPQRAGAADEPQDPHPRQQRALLTAPGALPALQAGEALCERQLPHVPAHLHELPDQAHVPCRVQQQAHRAAGIARGLRRPGGGGGSGQLSHRHPPGPGRPHAPQEAQPGQQLHPHRPRRGVQRLLEPHHPLAAREPRRPARAAEGPRVRRVRGAARGQARAADPGGGHDRVRRA
mmetsp:Transcript_4333/g.13922  ORF Transcript_4333/g.13922 Transcript_4333/m.13922 type:complete len:243 (-) Transcript_4333:440-1168(-)